MLEEEFPVSESLTVHQGTTIYKTDKWWLAVLLVDSFGEDRSAFTYGSTRMERGKENKIL